MKTFVWIFFNNQGVINTNTGTSISQCPNLSGNVRTSVAIFHKRIIQLTNESRCTFPLNLCMDHFLPFWGGLLACCLLKESTLYDSLEMCVVVAGHRVFAVSFTFSEILSRTVTRQ